MKPQDIHQQFHDRINMSAAELDALKESPNYAEYQERKSGGQEGTEPIDDAIRLIETPAREWECSDDDRFNECEQAQELLSFTDRMSEVEQGGPIPDTEPAVSKRDMSLMAWALDPNPDTKDFAGDKDLERESGLF